MNLPADSIAGSFVRSFRSNIFGRSKYGIAETTARGRTLVLSLRIAPVIPSSPTMRLSTEVLRRTEPRRDSMNRTAGSTRTLLSPAPGMTIEESRDDPRKISRSTFAKRLADARSLDSLSAPIQMISQKFRRALSDCPWR